MQKEKLKRLAPQLRDIDAKIDAENWRAEKGSQRIHDLLTILRIQLVEGSDPAEEKRLRGEVNKLLGERTKIETLRHTTLMDALQAEIKRFEKSGMLLAEGESIEDMAAESVRLAQAEAEAVAAREKGDAKLAELAAARDALQ